MPLSRTPGRERFWRAGLRWPMLLPPHSADQFYKACRASAAGTAIALMPEDASAEATTTSVERFLNNLAFPDRAGAVRAEHMIFPSGTGLSKPGNVVSSQLRVHLSRSGMTPIVSGSSAQRAVIRRPALKTTFIASTSGCQPALASSKRPGSQADDICTQCSNPENEWNSDKLCTSPSGMNSCIM